MLGRTVGKRLAGGRHLRSADIDLLHGRQRFADGLAEGIQSFVQSAFHHRMIPLVIAGHLRAQVPFCHALQTIDGLIHRFQHMIDGLVHALQDLAVPALEPVDFRPRLQVAFFGRARQSRGL